MPWWTDETPPTYYVYRPDTGEFYGDAPADPSPLEPGVWLLPACATWEAPPTATDGMASVFTAEGWRLLADYRGEVRYHEGDFLTVTDLGDPADWGLAPMVVHDAEYFLPDGDPEAYIRMWINDDEITFRDDPELMARKVLAAWEAQGETIRPVAFDPGQYTVVPPPQSLTPEEDEQRFHEQVDARVQAMIESRKEA